MRSPTIARNYADALLELARRSGDMQGWRTLIDDVARAIQSDRRLQIFLESPRVSAAQKNAVLTRAFEGNVPRPFLRFLQALVRNRRQNLIPEIAQHYHDLLDQVEGRIHATVTVAREADDAEMSLIAERLSLVVGKQVVPHVHVDPRIMGGVVARIGDTVFDGSVRKRLATLRSRMLRQG
jgi:F-type H+-transporting ATPase subunit delta